MATDTTITISRGDDWESILTFLVDGDALDVRVHISGLQQRLIKMMLMLMRL
jgi:hypothetical protein